MSARAPSLWMVAAGALLLLGGEIVLRDLWGADEVRCAYLAREMRETGQWLVPHWFGEPYEQKPPLFSWLVNAASLATGGEIGRAATRLPTDLIRRCHGIVAMRKDAWREIAPVLAMPEGATHRLQLGHDELVWIEPESPHETVP